MYAVGHGVIVEEKGQLQQETVQAIGVRFGRDSMNLRESLDEKNGWCSLSFLLLNCRCPIVRKQFERIV